MKTTMELASEELERRSRYLSSLIQRTKLKAEGGQQQQPPPQQPEVNPAKQQRHQHHRLPPQPEAEQEVNPAKQQKHQHHHLPPQPEVNTVKQQKHRHHQQQQQQKMKRKGGDGDCKAEEEPLDPLPENVRVRAADMPPALQRRAFRCAKEVLAAMPKLDSKRLALALKKEFDSTYGPAWHCIVGTSFGSYVTHSLGGFLYFSIDKLYVPGCMHLTGDGLVRVVERLSVQKGNLKLRLHSIGIITREHLDILSSFLPENSLQQGSKPFFYSYERAHSLEIDDDRPIDVAICPNCKNVRLVFDCTRKTCRDAINDFRSRNLNLSECRGCLFCITRCEECGGCLDFSEFEDAACPDFLCTECWLHLPKCNMCNRPYCKRHLNSEVVYFGSAGFTCEQCRVFEDSSYGCI